MVITSQCCIGGVAYKGHHYSFVSWLVIGSSLATRQPSSKWPGCQARLDSILICFSNTNPQTHMCSNSITTGHPTHVETQKGCYGWGPGDPFSSCHTIQLLTPFSPVPVIGDPAPIITLSSEVGDCIKRQVIIFIDEHLQLSDADTKVRFIEAIRNVPTKRTKLSPLLHQSMEETQAKQELLPHLEKGRERRRERGKLYFHLASRLVD